MESDRKIRHDTATWLGTLSMVLQLAESGYDFTTPEGAEILEEARRGLALIEAKLQRNAEAAAASQSPVR
jgi:hypothetical protein